MLCCYDACTHRRTTHQQLNEILQVYTPHEAILDQQAGKPKGTFGFTTKEAGDYKACFTLRGAVICQGP
jgi:hypothetical protein